MEVLGVNTRVFPNEIKDRLKITVRILKDTSVFYKRARKGLRRLESYE